MAPISTSKQAFNTWFFSKDWLVLENVDETLHGASRHLSIPCITHHSGSTDRFCEKAFPLWFKRGFWIRTSRWLSEMFATLPKSTYAILMQQRCMLLPHIPVYLHKYLSSWPPIIHGKNVARMWISVKKTKLQELTQGSLQFYLRSQHTSSHPHS